MTTMVNVGIVMSIRNILLRRWPDISMKYKILVVEVHPHYKLSIVYIKSIVLWRQLV